MTIVTSSTFYVPLTCLHFFRESLFQVTSPFGDIVHKKEKVSMEQFAFTTAEAGNYLACFSIDGEDRGLVVKLNLDWKIGIAARDWDSVAKKEKIKVKYMKMRCYTDSCCFVLFPFHMTSSFIIRELNWSYSSLKLLSNQSMTTCFF